MSQKEKNVKVAYFLNVFPSISETFILNEIIELKKCGAEVFIFSIFNPEQEIIHTEARKLAKKTYYFRNFINTGQLLKKLSAILCANFFLFIISPFRFLKAFHFICRLNNYKIFPRFVISAYYAFILKKLKVNHIHAHFAYIASEYAMLISMLSGIPYSFSIHAYDIFTKFRLMEEKISFSKFVISISEYNKKFIKEKCQTIDIDKVHIVHCGVNIKKLSACKPDIYRKKKPFLILSVSRLVEKKGLRYVLEACHILMQKGISDFLCKIVGHGLLQRELEELALNLNLAEKVQFLGPLSSDQVFPLLQRAAVVVLPCVVGKDGDMDGIPVSLMEAMAMGKPVVSTYISGIPELVKDGAGILVPPENAEALAGAIEKIYSMDLETRKKMGRKGREIVEREFNIEKESRKIRDLLIRFRQEIDD